MTLLNTKDTKGRHKEHKGKRFMAKRRGIVSELWLFIRENKAWWMTPIVIAVLLLAGLIILGAVGGGAAAPFIYTLF